MIRVCATIISTVKTTEIVPRPLTPAQVREQVEDKARDLEARAILKQVAHDLVAKAEKPDALELETDWLDGMRPPLVSIGQGDKREDFYPDDFERVGWDNQRRLICLAAGCLLVGLVAIVAAWVIGGAG